ncbi:hypothetical protein [Levilactobacillus sp. N40-8-2]|uniref:hypothetical protein n=1 Tax=Levilactobacillus muriae TaxID=3238987 RepID=UPI0038B38A5E
MQDPFKGFNNDDDPDNQNGDGPQGLPLPPNYATVVNPETGNMRIAKVGFSWTMFLFPPFPTLFRADWYNLFCIMGVELSLMMVLSMMVPVNQLAQFFAVGGWEMLRGFLWGFLYNMMYFKHLFTKGFVPADDRSKEILTHARYWSQPKDND